MGGDHRPCVTDSLGLYRSQAEGPVDILLQWQQLKDTRSHLCSRHAVQQPKKQKPHTLHMPHRRQNMTECRKPGHYQLMLLKHPI